MLCITDVLWLALSYWLRWLLGLGLLVVRVELFRLVEVHACFIFRCPENVFLYSSLGLVYALNFAR